MHVAGSVRNRRVMFPAPEHVVLAEEPVPPLQRGEVLVRTECSLISSGTEVTCLQGVFPPATHWGRWVTYPWYPGYQNIGSIVEIGAGVDGLAVGQRVATHSSH